MSPNSNIETQNLTSSAVEAAPISIERADMPVTAVILAYGKHLRDARADVLKA